MQANPKIQVLKNGPYIVSGRISLFSAIIQCGTNDVPTAWNFKSKIRTPQTYILCRCGQSKTKPFCDSSHIIANFDGTETSNKTPFKKFAKTIDGPELSLRDAEILCASARFCHRGGDIWDEIPRSDQSETKQNSIRNACDCPSGRLVVTEKKTGQTVEPTLEKSIGLIEDPNKGVSGPLWIRGGISVFSSDGKPYEVRNRITLCRCGKSQNKPFCDSSHYPVEDREVT